MSINVLIDQARKQNLKNYIQEQGYRSLTQFAKSNWIYVSNLSPILNGPKKFTDKLATRLELKLGLEPGYLSKVSVKVAENRLIPFKSLQSFDDQIELIDDGEFLSLDKSAINVSKYNPENLFAIHPLFKINREVLKDSVASDKVLIFDGSDKELADSKIYLVKFAEHYLLRRFTKEYNSSGILDTDQPELYAKISAPSHDLEVVARLIYAFTLQEY